MYPYWKHLALSWITSKVRSNSPQLFWKHRLQLFSKHFLKTWAFPASLTICYRHLGMGAAYYNALCDSHDTLWASSYSTASSSTKSSSALIRSESELPESPPHSCICKFSGQFNLCATCTQALAEVTVETWRAEMRWYPRALQQAVPGGQGVSPDKDALQEVRQQKDRMCMCHTLNEQC